MTYSAIFLHSSANSKITFSKIVVWSQTTVYQAPI